MARERLPSGTDVEVALPPGDVPNRGLVVIPDIMGLRPLFADLAARLAADHAWAVAVIEPFPGEEDLDLDGRFRALRTKPDAGIVGDATAAAELLRDRADVGRVGVLGFCMGGMYTYKAAGSGRFDRAVSFYGMIRVPDDWKGDGDQAEPLDCLRSREACPTLAIVGGQDRWTPPADVEALRAAGAHVTVRVYEEADHGFVHDPSRPAHRPHDADDAWRWAVEFLA